MTGILIGLVVVALILVWLRHNVSASASVVVTGPGVLKTHDVECRFRSNTGYHGKLSQSRWSDGQERFQLNLRRLPGSFTGTVSMLYHGKPIADFEANSGRISFATKSADGADTPKLEIGEEIVLEFGGQTLTGIVEPD